MVRAVATGVVIARELGLPLRAWEELHEEGGIYLADAQTGERVGLPGKNRAYFAAHYPDLILPASLDSAGWWNRPHETPDQVPARVARFHRDLLARHGQTEDRVAVISHGGFYNHLLRLIFQIGRENCWLGLNNAAITRIDFDADELRLVYLNRADFLPRDLVT
jgi:2,3-bisphosphoglycerate-dependent phosphoglycerate mutase